MSAAAPVVLDGAALTCEQVARMARDAAPAVLDDRARARNRSAREALNDLLAQGRQVYGVTTGVGALRSHRFSLGDSDQHELDLLRSHACGAGPPLDVTVVRAAMAARANQIAAGGAGVAPELLDGLVAALNGGLTPFTRELGSLGTGDLVNLADIGLALVGEGRVWLEGELMQADRALALAGLAPARLQARDALAFMSSNAVTIGRAALLAVEAGALLEAWLTVAALSFEAAGADPVVLDERLHPSDRRPGQAAVAALMRALLGDARTRARQSDPPAVQDPYPFRVLPQVDGAVHDALAALRMTACRELNLAGENALVVTSAGVALPNGNFHAAALAAALDQVRAALASAAGLIAARVSALLDAGVTRLQPFLARRPGPESGALMLEYTVHDAAAEVRSLVAPAAAQAVSVGHGVESHSSLAPIAARRLEEALAALRVAVACELVVAVRALRLAGSEPRGDGAGALWDAATPLLDPEMRDRPLADDVEAARRLVECWPRADSGD